MGATGLTGFMGEARLWLIYWVAFGPYNLHASLAVIGRLMGVS